MPAGPRLCEDARREHPHEDSRSHRSPYRRRRGTPRSVDGPRSHARRRNPADARPVRGERQRPRQPRRTAQPLAAAGGWLPAPARGASLEPGGPRRGLRVAVRRAAADPPGRRPLPGDRLDQRCRAPLPRPGPHAARAVARRARRLQHYGHHPDRKHPRYAGRDPSRHGPGRADLHRRSDAGDRRRDGAADRDSQRRCRRKAARARGRHGGLRHAQHRRARDAQGHAQGPGGRR